MNEVDVLRVANGMLAEKLVATETENAVLKAQLILLQKGVANENGNVSAGPVQPEYAENNHGEGE
ncbi:MULTISPECIES: hypothetical protein [Bacillus cereus group]|uniref:hypothetical protein n=1 Tax=Bacillus cereus group TaxID=86661 RepID=UPI000278B997|nr:MULTISPECIES: hypothetical protein [Bacillus cereus group]EJQ55437.1 hypothetical protein IEI_00700 [Bacillus wiedmannii]MCU4797021.1 hypothetical protein [Bacillus cereus]MDA2621625.1 hypothetical protein [Bacillus cereus]MRB24586.1 hypothetical protein [Bacillus thuringiensis]